MIKTYQRCLLMKTVLLSFCFALSTCAAVPVLAADSASCYAIGDADARQYCLAKARKEPSTCYAIQSSGLRAQCLAEVRR